MNKRIIKYGLLSLLIGIVLLVLAMPITMIIIGHRPIIEVAFIATLYTYSGYVITAGGVVLVIVGIIKKQDD